MTIMRLALFGNPRGTVFKNRDLHRILRHCHIDMAVTQRDMARSLATLPAGAGSISDFSYQIETAIEPAWVFPTPGFDDNRVRGAWLVTAVEKASELRRILLGISPAFQKIPLKGWTKHDPYGSTARRNLRTCLMTEPILQTRRMRWTLIATVPLSYMTGARRFVA
jgi:hypothetical protein